MSVPGAGRTGVTIRALGATESDAFLAVNDAVGWHERRAMFEFHVSREDSILFVASLDGDVVGCGGATVFPGGSGTVRGRTGWVHSIVVHP